MTLTNQISLPLTKKFKKQAAIPLDIPESVNSLSPKRYIPFYSLLLNQSLGFPYPEIQEGMYLRTGHQFDAEIITRFRLHPVFVTARQAELAIRQNDLSILGPEALLKDIEPDLLPLLNNLGLNGNTFIEELLSLAVVYRNTAAVVYLIDHWDVSPDKGMESAVGEINPQMTNLLIERGASTGTYLQQALVADNVNIEVIKVLLNHDADKSLKLDGTGDHAYSCARKTQKKYRKALVSLISEEKIRLSNAELQSLEEWQTPDEKYSIEYIDFIGKSLTESLDKHEDVEQLNNKLIQESSTESLRYLVDAFLNHLNHRSEYDKSKQGRMLRDAIFHLNFQVPENIGEFVRVIPYLNHRDKNELLFLFQKFKTEDSRLILKREVPEVDHGVYSRLRACERPFAERLHIDYPDIVEEMQALEVDSEGRLLRFFPTNDFKVAFDEAEALSKTTELLKDKDSMGSVISEDQLKYFLRSLIEERRVDMDSHVRRLWCIYSTDRLRSDDWHDLLHRPTIHAVSWLIYLYVSKPDWISEVLHSPDDAVEGIGHEDSRELLVDIINSSLEKLAAWKLSSRRHGGIFQIEAMELLKAAGVERFMKGNRHSSFSRMWKTLITDFRNRVEQDGKVTVDAFEAIGGDIGVRGEVDVTGRIEHFVV